MSGTTQAHGGLSEALLGRLSDAAAQWVDAGPATGWEPVHSRFGKPVGTPDKRAQIVFTRVPNPPTDPAILRWGEHANQLVVPKSPARAVSLVFTRVAVRQRAFALGAHPRADLTKATERARRMVARAAGLQVVLGFFPNELVPSWLLHDGDQPVLLGLPHHHLVPTLDPARSLAAILGAARVKATAHDVEPTRIGELGGLGGLGGLAQG